MASASATNFIETALSCNSPFALSYPEPKQKLVIRKHLLSLIQEHPTFSLSTGTFTHNDGKTVNLLHASGQIRISNYTAPITLTIWLHENYPYVAPMVFASSNSLSPIHRGYPFFDPSSGTITSSYLQNWLFPGNDLTTLVRKLAKLFSCDHPFTYSPAAASFTDPSLVSKTEALDRLWGMLHYDLMALNSKYEEEVEGLSKLRGELMNRNDIITSIIVGLDHETKNVKERILEVMHQSDLIINWLRINDGNSLFSSRTVEDSDEAFEAVDEKSKSVIDCLAADRAIDDLIDVLDKALERQVLTIDAYVKQVRASAREQFYSRRMLV